MFSFTLMQVCVPLILAASPQAAFYVAPDGNDGQAGTLEAPFASVARAQEAVRERIREGLSEDLLVLLRGGAYRLDKPLVFGPEDGHPKHAVTYAAYPDEQPVLSGGQPLSGWVEAGDGKWTVTLPAVKAGTWHFRQLFADGERLPRGRFPNGDDLLRVRRVSEDVTRIELNEALPGGDLAGQDAELVMYQNWSISRVAVVSSEGKTVVTRNPVGWIGHGPATTASPNKPAYIEHVLAFVDQPGEWYLDRRSGVLTYQAAPGENPKDREFVAPRIEQWITVQGRPDAPVRNLHVRGLAFEHTAWPLPEFGYLGIQAGHHGTKMEERTYVLPLGIAFFHAEDCAVEGCRVAHSGACAIGFGAGCRRNAVTGCTLEDIGGNGIMTGWRGTGNEHSLAGNASLAADWRNAADVPQGNAITNNTIQRCGAVNHGSVGIFDAFCANTRIAHNQVNDMPYTGISIGFEWSTKPTNQRGCALEYNHVYDVMKKLADGGAIYTLGLQPGTVLRGNLLHTVHRSAYAHGGAPNNGIFFDQGSKGYLVEGNIIYDTSGDAVRFNQTGTENLTWKDNHFGVAPDNPAFPKAAAKEAGPRS